MVKIRLSEFVILEQKFWKTIITLPSGEALCLGEGALALIFKKTYK